MRGFWSVYPYQAHLREAVHRRSDLYGVAVYHPAYGHHETAVFQVALCDPRSILFQRGPDLTARHEREERRLED
jgi:hypothetical protein